jgi:hypothetical protein
MAAYNPMAPLNQKQQRQLARRYAQAQFGPVLAQINAEYARRAQSGANAISSSTQQLAAQLAPQAAQTHANYAGAQDAQAALDQAIAAKLSGAGAAASADVGKQLGAAGIPQSVDLAKLGAGAGAASFGIGSAAQSRLIAQGAAAENYAGTLPALARLGGTQRGQDLALQLEHGRQTDVGNLRAKIPGAVSQIEQSLGNQEIQKSIAVQSGLISGAKLQQSQSQFQQREQRYAQQNQVSNLYKAAGLKISQEQLGIAQQREKRLQQGKKGTAGGYTPSQISKFRATAIDTVKDWKHGVPGTTYADGSPKNAAIPGRPKDARGAFRYLVNHGIPPSMADWAVGQVYGKWKVPGEGSKRGSTGSGPR